MAATGLVAAVRAGPVRRGGPEAQH